MMRNTTTQTPEKKNTKPVTDHDGGSFQPPPIAGSVEEYAETALAVGWPGAFMTSHRVEQLIRSRLLWGS
jgi:hypothetical protein